METADSIELIVALIFLLFTGISWLIRKLKGLARSPSTFASRPLPRSTSAPPSRTSKRLIPLVPLATFLSVLLSSFGSIIWISIRPDFSPEIDEKLSYLMAFYLCVGGPLIAAFAVLFTSALSNLFSEFQGKPLTRWLRALIGAALGLVVTVPTFLLISSE